MARIKHAVSTRRRKKRVLKQTKGQFGQRSRRYRQAKRSLIKGLAFAFRDRKANKRSFRRLWTVRINAACRAAGTSYSRFIDGLVKSKISINRPMLAELAVNSPRAFEKLVHLVVGNGSAKPAAKPSPKKT